jgi:hypothetical protein
LVGATLSSAVDDDATGLVAAAEVDGTDEDEGAAVGLPFEQPARRLPITMATRTERTEGGRVGDTGTSDAWVGLARADEPALDDDDDQVQGDPDEGDRQ